MDYTVTYENNTNAGTASLTITGQGDYNGEIRKTFTILRASIAVAKRTPRGTYKIKVQIMAKGTRNYESGTKKVTIKVTVK